jgi:cytochrome P450
MDNMSTTDGESHARQRRLVASAFSRQRIEALQPRIAQVVTRALDDLAALAAAEPGAPIDLREQYAHPVASQVIGELLGVPPADRDGILNRAGYEQATPQEMAEAVAVIRRNVESLVAAKRRDPGEDVVSDLIAAVPAGCPVTGVGRGSDVEGVSDAELVLLVLLLLNTGTEPPRNLITSAVAALLTRPDQRELVRTGQATWDDVVEEVLRADAPVAHMPFRFAVQDVTVAGVKIAQGDPVLVNFAATGRDPDLHGTSAAEYDAGRTDKRHLAFGHGAHRCVGPALGRLEARIAVQSLFTRFPGMRLAVEPEQITGLGTLVMNGRRALPVHL